MNNKLFKIMAVILCIITAVAFTVPSDAHAASIKTKRPSVSVTAASETALTVKWNMVSGASGYKVYRAASKSGSYKCIKTVTLGSTVKYKNTGRTPGKTYYYKVRAYKKSGGKKIYSKYSYVKSGKTAVDFKNAKPKLDAYKVSDEKVKLKWTKIAGTEGYIVSKADAENPEEWTEVADITDTELIVDADESLTYKVVAYKTIGGSRVLSKESNYQDAVSDESEDENAPADMKYNAPNDLRGHSENGSGVLKWSGTNDEYLRCAVYRADVVDGITGEYRFIDICNDTSTSYKNFKYGQVYPHGYFKFYDKTAERGKIYSYKVRYGNEGEAMSGYSDAVEVTIAKVDTPAYMTAFRVGYNDFMNIYDTGYVGWGKVDGATYELQYKVGADGTWMDMPTNSAVTDVTDTDRMFLKFTTTRTDCHYYRVRAVAGGEVSEWTEPVARVADEYVIERDYGDDNKKIVPVGDTDCNHEFDYIISDGMVFYDDGYICNKPGAQSNHYKAEIIAAGSGQNAGLHYRCIKCGHWYHGDMYMD